MDAEASAPGGPGAPAAQPAGLDLALDDLIRSAKKPRGGRPERGPGGRGNSVPVRRGGVDKHSSRGGRGGGGRGGGGRGGGRGSILSRLGPPPGARPGAVPFVDNLTGYKKARQDAATRRP